MLSYEISEIIENVPYDNYDDFQLVNFIFSQKVVSLIWRSFNGETNLTLGKAHQISHCLCQWKGPSLREFSFKDVARV
jgi:hypothetical protein